MHLLLQLMSWLTLAWASLETKPGCHLQCGNITIPYPFGIGKACSRGAGYNINCNTAYNPPRPFTGNLEVLEISRTQVRTKNWIAYTCFAESGAKNSTQEVSIDLTGTPFTFSETANKFTGTGCDTLAYIEGSSGVNYSSACLSLCDQEVDVIDGSCSGTGCCQIPIPEGLKKFSATAASVYNHTKIWSFDRCSYAFLAEHERYTFKASDFLDPDFLNRIENVPVVFDWVLENKTCEEAQKNLSTYACQENSTCDYSDKGAGYRCLCKQGYRGNPYLNPGCQGMIFSLKTDAEPCLTQRVDFHCLHVSLKFKRKISYLHGKFSHKSTSTFSSKQP